MTNSGWAEQYGESHSPKSVVGAEPHTFVLVSNNVIGRKYLSLGMLNPTHLLTHPWARHRNVDTIFSSNH